jgi:hypothetical protein
VALGAQESNMKLKIFDILTSSCSVDIYSPYGPKLEFTGVVKVPMNIPGQSRQKWHEYIPTGKYVSLESVKVLLEEALSKFMDDSCHARDCGAYKYEDLMFVRRIITHLKENYLEIEGN